MTLKPRKPKLTLEPLKPKLTLELVTNQSAFNRKRAKRKTI